MENKKTKKDQTDRLEEMKKLIEQSKDMTSIQPLLFPLEELGDEDISFDSNIFSDIADPDKSHRLFFTMRRMLIDNLPRGKENKALRQQIYDQKNLFLNRGKALDKNGIRHSSGQMTYISTFLEPAFNVTADWVKSGGGPMDIFMAFYDLNKANGFSLDL
ncbi:hypothetical protein [Dyadobacter sp. CY343]|uniref:hypothetical protein n=1 Tax=Dyadobacter sp. CY343 TaxID=2907299 RepID=UPI001F338EE9|nr:hypothetical protein [Dyadobacter sp. CY343]MCE7063165.1 hypothetical protein [Dyadobacter sp. CY343]